MSFDFSGWSDTFEDYERATFAQLTGFKRCHLSAPLYLDYISTGFVNILGYTPEAIHEQFNSESVGFVHPDDAEEYQKLLRHFAEKEMTATFHYRVICKDGSVKYLNDTMKSVFLNGEMWGFSCVSDATALNDSSSLGVEAFVNSDALVSLCFDMDTHQRIPVHGDTCFLPLREDASVEEVYGALAPLVHPQDEKVFADNLTVWHLRDKLSFECRLYSKDSSGRPEYRWMRVTTVCLVSHSGARGMVLNIEDVNDVKLVELKAAQAMGLDWLTGLLNCSAFHALCLNRGLTDGGGCVSDPKMGPAFSSLRAVDYSVYADLFENDPAFRLTSEKYDFRSIVAISFDAMPATGNDMSFYTYNAAVKRAASSLRLATMDGDLVTRVDAGLFFVMPMNKLSKNEYIDKARILLSSMMVPLEGGGVLSARAGISLVKVGETYENAVGLALQSLEEAMREDEACIVFRAAENPHTSFVHSVFGGQSFVRHDDAVSEEAKPSAGSSEAVAETQIDPVDTDEVHVLTHLVSLSSPLSVRDARIGVRTFGYFDVFVDGRAVVFRSQKAKELLALLVDHHGGFVTPAFAISCLWESESDSKAARAKYRKVALNLRRTLEENGISEIMEEHNGSRRIVPESVDCDLFNYKVGNRDGRNEFRGVYLPDYSWGEMTLAQLAHESMM